MSKSVLRFGPQDNIRFIKIYKSYECLWDPQNADYKNREARDEALRAFATELAFYDIGPKEIVLKIKNMRSQYLQEMKKIKSSIGTGQIYTPKLTWFQLMDSFIRRVVEGKTSVSNSSDTESNNLEETISDNTQRTHNPNSTDNHSIPTVSTHSDQSPVEEPRENIQTERPIMRKRKFDSISIALNKLDDIEQRASTQNDDLSAFGNYVVTTLRKLNARNCLRAQDEIYTVLSRYKLRELADSEAAASNSGSPLTPQSTSTVTEENWLKKEYDTP